MRNNKLIKVKLLHSICLWHVSILLDWKMIDLKVVWMPIEGFILSLKAVRALRLQEIRLSQVVHWMGWLLEESLQTWESCSPPSKITPCPKEGLNKTWLRSGKLNKLNKHSISMMKNNNKNETNQLGQIINSLRWGELQRNTTAKPLGKKQGFKV